MKKNISILLFLVSMVGWSQLSKIKNKELTVNGSELIGNDKSVLLNNFGPPISISDFYYEISEKNAKVYTYSDAVFYVVDDHIETFEIKGASYEVTKNAIKVGIDISLLSKIFPDSYLQRKNSGIQVDFSDIDYYVVFSYDPISAKITKIAVYEY